MCRYLKSYVILLCVILLPTACISIRRLDDQDLMWIDTIVRNMTTAVEVEHEYEYELIENGITQLLTYMAEAKRGVTMDDLEQLSTISALSDYSLRVLGMTPVELGLDAFIYWDEHTAFDYEEHDQVEYESEHFLYRVFPETRANEDIQRIIYLCEKYVSELITFVEQDASSLSSFYRNFDHLQEKKIIIELPPNSKLWTGFNKTAHMEFGFNVTNQGLVTTISIALPYYNSLSSSVLTHEITHMIDLLMKIDLEEIACFSGPLSEENKQQVFDWWNGVLDDIFPHDTQFGEGFAEYTAYRYSIFHKNFLLNPEERLGLTRGKRPIRSDILDRPTTSLNRRTRLLQYTELQSLVTYLIDCYGKERFLQFYFTPPLTEEHFVEVYRMSYREAEDAWKEYYGF